MQTYSTAIHFDGTEWFRLSGGINHDAIYVASSTGAASLSLVMSHSIPTGTRVAFLESLAEQAQTLAGELRGRAADDAADLDGAA